MSRNLKEISEAEFIAAESLLLLHKTFPMQNNLNTSILKTEDWPLALKPIKRNDYVQVNHHMGPSNIQPNVLPAKKRKYIAIEEVDVSEKMDNLCDLARGNSSKSQSWLTFASKFVDDANQSQNMMNLSIGLNHKLMERKTTSETTPRIQQAETYQLF